ncbi:MAG TPA: hypothetical protein VJZ02_03920 [Candidatus Brocadiales bacterium]|nr:hypothetical protein [Candidatus Brocadiales bacterium]
MIHINCFHVKKKFLTFVDDMEGLLPKWFGTSNMTMGRWIDKDL